MKKLLIILLLILSSISFANAGVLVGALSGRATTGSTGYPWVNVLRSSYNFESGALDTDSTGTNTLTSNAGVTASTTHAIQGTYSALFNPTNTGNSYRVNTSLSTNFPGRGDDASYTNFLVTGWFYVNSHNATFGTILSKWCGTNNTATYTSNTQRAWKFVIGYFNSAYYPTIWIRGTADNANTAYYFTSTQYCTTAGSCTSYSAGEGGFPSTIPSGASGKWYHFGYYHDANSGKIGFILYDYTGATEGIWSLAYTSGMNDRSESAFAIGAYRCYDGTPLEYFNGWIDRVAIYSWGSSNYPTEAQIISKIRALQTPSASFTE